MAASKIREVTFRGQKTRGKRQSQRDSQAKTKAAGPDDGGRVPPKSWLPLSRSFFQDTLLELLLALDTMPRPRHGFQALGIDFLAAVDAFAEAALADA